MNKWNVSIKELLLNYRGALQSLIPWLEKNQIPYKEGEAYDDWDSISINLYDCFVLNSIIYCEQYGELQKFAKYNYAYDNYADMGFILCKEPFGNEEFIVFVSFIAEDNFEIINVNYVDRYSLNVLSKGTLRLSDAHFYLYQKKIYEYITVDL